MIYAEKIRDIDYIRKRLLAAYNAAILEYVNKSSMLLSVDSDCAYRNIGSTLSTFWDCEVR